MGNTMSKSKTMSKTNTMSKNSWVCNSMGNRACNHSWMSNSMSNRMGKNCRMSDSMSNWMGSNSVSIGSNTVISNISNISIIVIGMICDVLDAAIRKVDRVGTFYNTSTIIGLSLVEGSARVVISNSISVRVGRGFSKVRLCISTNSMGNNWGMVEHRAGNCNWMSNSNWMSYTMTNKTMSKDTMTNKAMSNDSMTNKTMSKQGVGS